MQSQKQTHTCVYIRAVSFSPDLHLTHTETHACAYSSTFVHIQPILARWYSTFWEQKTQRCCRDISRYADNAEPEIPCALVQFKRLYMQQSDVNTKAKCPSSVAISYKCLTGNVDIPCPSRVLVEMFHQYWCYKRPNRTSVEKCSLLYDDT